MRKFLFILLAFYGLSVNVVRSQTLVFTSPQNRNVVLETFCMNNGAAGTGQFVYQSHADEISTSILESNPDFCLINIHQGSYSNKYLTSWGNALANQTGMTGWPAGTINRHVFDGLSNTALDRSSWVEGSTLVRGMPSCVNIGATASIDTSSRTLTVNVEVYYTGNAETAENFLNVVLLQDNIVGDFGSAPYVFNHVLRDMITGQWGESLSVDGEPVIPAGSFFTKTYTYSIPETISNEPVVLADLKCVVFVAKDHQEIYNGITVNPNQSAGSVMFSLHSEKQCVMSTPVVDVKNMGTTPVTQLLFSVERDGESYQKTWTGNLPSGGTTSIALTPSYLPLDGTVSTTNVHVVQMNGNSISVRKSLSEKLLVGIPPFALYYKTTASGMTTTWHLYNSVGDTLLGESRFVSYEEVKDTTTFSLTDCYTFECVASEGTGIYYIVDSRGVIIVQSIAGSSASRVAFFAAPGICEVTADTNHHNKIIFTHAPTTVPYRVYREEVPIAIIPAGSSNIWEDNTSNAQSQAYRYSVRAFADSANWVGMSNSAHQTMHLVVNHGDGNTWNLQWTPYMGVEYTAYNIYRVTGNSYNNMQLIKTLPSYHSSFTDVTAPAGKVHYQIEIVSGNNCSDRAIRSNIASNIAEDGTGIAAISPKNLQVYPNPAKDHIVIAGLPRDLLQNVQIFDLTGRIIVNGQLSTLNSIDVSTLSTGMYLLRVQTTAGTVMKKFVKE
ncbi:MAG: Omp28-related outer membrane protein [Bacteroidales bacterium]|jgi:hypothetical protein|nr:Omp28-related outer membrane protein [Bacteroidales bacterium]